MRVRRKYPRGLWKKLTGTDRHERAGLVINSQTPITLHFKIEKTAGPQTELAAV